MRKWPLLITLLGSTLGSLLNAGCIDMCATTKANGKKEVLRFEVPENPAAGMIADVTIFRGADGWAEGPFIHLSDSSRCFDFEDAKLELQFPPGFPDPEAKIELTHDFHVSFRCNGAPGVPQEVGVKVIDTSTGETTYEDAFDITCKSIDKVTLAPWSDKVNVREPVGNKFIVGGRIRVSTALSNGKTGGLTGRGLVPLDSPPPLVAVPVEMNPFEPPAFELFEIREPAVNPTLAAGNVTATLPVELVDPSEWTLDLALKREATGVNVSVWPVLADGTKLNGLETCAITVSSHGTREKAGFNDSCDLDHLSDTLQTTNLPIDQVCVSAAGRDLCKPWPAH